MLYMNKHVQGSKPERLHGNIPGHFTKKKDKVRFQELDASSIRRSAIPAIKAAGTGFTPACCLPFLCLCLPVDGLGSWDGLARFGSFVRLGSFDCCGAFDGGAFGGFTGISTENVV